MALNLNISGPQKSEYSPEVGEIFGTNRGLPASSTQLAGMDRHPDAAYLFGQDITPSENLSCSVDEAVHTEVAEPRIAQDGDHASPLPELARCLGGPNHAPTDPVLHTSGRVC